MAGWYFFWVYRVGLLGGGAIAGGFLGGCAGGALRPHFACVFPL